MTNNDQCLAHLRAGGWVLTRSQRQARILRHLHDRARLAAGEVIWPTARVVPLATWLNLQWQEAAAERPELPELLPAGAITWLWRETVAADAGGLLDPAALGASARTSWLQLREHSGDSAGLRQWPLTHDQRAFLRWSTAVERMLSDRAAADAGDLTRLAVQMNALPPAGMPLLFAGFHRLTPAQSTMIAALRDRGWRLELVSPATAQARQWRHAAADPVAEERVLASWLRSRLEADPAGIHAVIIPGLAGRREALERTLAGQLQPALELPGGTALDRVFDLAGGTPLRQHAVVAGALDALQCLPGLIGWELASRMLRSQWLAGAGGEGPARLRAELALRSADPRLEWGSQALAEHATRHGATGFAATLAATGVRASGPRRQGAGAWAEHFGQALAAWGWPGERQLTSGEYQAAEALRTVLRELASLDRVAGSLDLQQALAELARATAAPFQPERGEPAVFVLDALEPPGLWFDSLWIAGLTAAAWPQPTAVDAWLPIEIQRRLGMPGITAEDRVAAAREALTEWQRSCGELVLSWTCTEDDTAVDASVMLPDCPPLPVPAAPPRREDLLFAARQLEVHESDPAPARGPEPARGGARLLELQARCPFRAFAELRLAAAPLEEPGPSPDPLRRGRVLHRALEYFWLETGSRSGLQALAPEQLEERVAGAVGRALRDRLPAGSGVRGSRLEQDWQEQAILRLLELERGRPDFEVVEAERRMSCRLGGLELQLCVDRVDRIGDSLLVIDYKTGRATPAQWRGARPEAPQLPLYAVLHPDRPAGIALALLAGGSTRFTGVAREAGLLDGVCAAAAFELTEAGEKGFDWQQITQHWWAWLDRLARDHAAGHAEVDPRQGAESCRGCHLGPLCRVAAMDDGADAEEAGDDASGP